MKMNSNRKYLLSSGYFLKSKAFQHIEKPLMRLNGLVLPGH